MGTTRIPRTPEEMNTYLETTSPHLEKNFERLNITLEEKTQWVGVKFRWTPLFVKFSDKYNSCTPAVRNEIYELIEEIVDLDRENMLLDRIASAPEATSADWDIFGIGRSGRSRSVKGSSQSPIVEMVHAIVQPIGGGTVRVKCYSNGGGRAGIIDTADCIQYLYMVGSTPPVSVNEVGLVKEVSTKGNFTLQAGQANVGKSLFLYFRWYSIKHPEIAGPWSNLQATILL